MVDFYVGTVGTLFFDYELIIHRTQFEGNNETKDPFILNPLGRKIPIKVTDNVKYITTIGVHTITQFDSFCPNGKIISEGKGSFL